MKKYIYIFLFSNLFLCCEKIDVIDVDTGFQEKIVVVAELMAYNQFEGIKFTKTLPLEEEYDILKAELKEVKAYLKQNNYKVIPLHYEGNGVYNSIYDIRFKSGDVYELFAIYDGKSIYSKTVIPEKPSVRNVRFSNDNFLEASVDSKTSEVYGALWVIQTGSTKYIAPDFYNIYQNQVTAYQDDILLRTKDIPEEYQNYKSSTFIQVISFDETYLDYYQTRNNNQPIEDTFSQIGAPIKWNVYGEGVIGMFMGMAESDLITAK